MDWAVIATWKMSLDGLCKASELLEMGTTVEESLIIGVNNVEDNPAFHSVGLGGRPNREGHVTMDAGFMDGDTLHFGAVADIEGFRSPIRIAQSLVDREANNLLVGRGAEEYARAYGFDQRDNLTDESKAMYQEEKGKRKDPSPYRGHDTVCFLAKDIRGKICSATSTSGLFMKDPGRIGDTPFPGAGYYADSYVGAAASTGMGEEIMKGSCSFLAVQYMKQGMDVKEAADKTVRDLDNELVRRNGHAQPISLIAMDKDGNWGVGTNVPFTFTYASSSQVPTLYEVLPSVGGPQIHPFVSGL
jgi:N4-(beta-N-acetylglucosaminyl)-L-asparaginase